jgi:hypothetical protein
MHRDDTRSTRRRLWIARSLDVLGVAVALLPPDSVRPLAAIPAAELIAITRPHPTEHTRYW